MKKNKLERQFYFLQKQYQKIDQAILTELLAHDTDLAIISELQKDKLALFKKMEIIRLKLKINKYYQDLRTQKNNIK